MAGQRGGSNGKAGPLSMLGMTRMHYLIMDRVSATEDFEPSCCRQTGWLQGEEESSGNVLWGMPLSVKNAGVLKRSGWCEFTINVHLNLN